MSGIVLEDGVLSVDREPNQLDELAIGFSQILDQLGIEHVYVAGYVSILAGRARSTEDVDVLIEPLDEATATEVATTLTTAGYWGPVMPLDSLHEMLTNGDPIWVAPADQVTPHLEVKHARDKFDRAWLSDAITAEIGDDSIPIGPLELQIAYKLSLGSQKDIEDAVHLYTLFAETLRMSRLEVWVQRLDVESEYERLRQA